MLENIQLHKLLFIDIETVSQYPKLEEAPEQWQQLWTNKMRYSDDAPAELYEENAALYAEFSKVICIGLGYFSGKEDELIFRQKVIQAPTEKEILEQLGSLINQYFGKIQLNKLCGHNIKAFDIPFLCRRYLVNGMPLPNLLNVHNMKPWEIPFLDTMQLWQFGDYRQRTSLSLLAHTLGIATPKPTEKPVDMHQLYWKENNLEQLIEYAKNDVLATARIILKLKGLEDISMEQIIFVEDI